MDLPIEDKKETKSIFPKYDFKEKRNIFLVVGVIILFTVFFFFFVSPPSDFPKGEMINIKDGASLRSVSGYLAEKNVIRSRAMFETFVILFGGEKYLASGDYYLEGKLSALELARRLSKGDRHLAPIKVTIPEGFNLSEIAKTFASKLPDFNQEKFLTEAKGDEGYLFPDTYFFLTTDTEKDVLLAMSDNFKKKISKFESEISSSGKTEKEIITMASLIEEESKGDEDRNIISGILWKRISIGMPLQVDAAPDTYKTRGLPEEPICNPGEKAILAALHPEKSPYLYYLHDKSGIVHYARTFEEHKQNKSRYLK